MKDEKRNPHALFRLLNRPVPEQDLLAWTALAAAPRAEAKTDMRSALIFRIGPEWVALPADIVFEVAESRKFHRLPHRSNGVVLGLVNVRGRLVPCVAPAGFLNVEPEEPIQWSSSAKYRLIVIGQDETRFAIPANEVQSIHRFSFSELNKPPLTLAKSAQITGIFEWNGKKVGYIDPELLMDFLRRSI